MIPNSIYTALLARCMLLEAELVAHRNGPTRYLSALDIAQMRELRSLGMTVTAISLYVGRSRKTVTRYVARRTPRNANTRRAGKAAAC